MPQNLFADPLALGAVFEAWAEHKTAMNTFTVLAKKARIDGHALGNLPAEVHAMISEATYNVLHAAREDTWTAYRLSKHSNSVVPTLWEEGYYTDENGHHPWGLLYCLVMAGPAYPHLMQAKFRQAHKLFENDLGLTIDLNFRPTRGQPCEWGFVAACVTLEPREQSLSGGSRVPESTLVWMGSAFEEDEPDGEETGQRQSRLMKGLKKLGINLMSRER